MLNKGTQHIGFEIVFDKCTQEQVLLNFVAVAVGEQEVGVGF